VHVARHRGLLLLDQRVPESNLPAKQQDEVRLMAWNLCVAWTIER
jgi:hypothetical protein